MRYLFSNMEHVVRVLKNKFIYLFLDYDGTIAPIAEMPSKAITPKKSKILLRKIAGQPNCKIAIVSGRAIDDVMRLVGIKKIVYVGNHGFEIKGPKINFKSPASKRYSKVLKELKIKLTERLRPFKGVVIEDKGLSLSVHYRLVARKDVVKLKTEFYACTIIYEVRGDLKVQAGKMVFEVRSPVVWDKGKAVLWLLGRQMFVNHNNGIKILPIYIGDDTTDEDAFRVLKKKGITVFVGKPKKTAANMYLKNTKDVARFLSELMNICGEHVICREKKLK